MLDEESGVEAYVTPYGLEHNDHYHDWQAPVDTPLHSGDKNQCYIEAVTDERFVVQVVLPTKFDFKRAPEVKITMDIDNGTVSIFSLVKDTQPWTEPTVTRLRQSRKRIGNECKLVSFTFGQLNLADDVDLSEDQESLEIAKRGTIVVTIQRGKSKGAVPHTCGQVNTLPEETNKVVAVSHGKSHSLKFGDLGLTNEKTTSTRFEALSGKSGKKVTFTFFYTSRMFLEIKKVIPISLPPAPAPAAAPRPKLARKPSLKDQPKRDIVEISDDCDDEEPLPQKKIKTEDVGDRAKSQARDVVSTQSTTIESPKKQSVNEKEKNMLKLRLEEIQIKRRLMELEDEDAAKCCRSGEGDSAC